MNHFHPHSPDRYIKKSPDMELAKFGHLNAIVDVLNQQAGVNTGLVPFIGGTQLGAIQLNPGFNATAEAIGVAGASTILPNLTALCACTPCGPIAPVVMVNTTSHPIVVYPFLGESVDGVLNTSVTINPGESLSFKNVSCNNWQTYGASGSVTPSLPCVDGVTILGTGLPGNCLHVAPVGGSACPYISNADYPGVPLGRAATFELLAGGAGGALTIGLAAQVVTGDVGQFGAMTGTPVIVSGNDYSSNSAQANQAAYAGGAITDATTLYNALLILAGGVMPASLNGGGNGVITPGVYTQAGAMTTSANTVITLNGAGCYVFISTGGNIAPGADTMIVLTNGALASNVYWVTAGGMSASGVDSIWKGTVLSPGAITTGAHFTIEGRLISTAAAIILGAGNANGIGAYFVPLK